MCFYNFLNLSEKLLHLNQLIESRDDVVSIGPSGPSKTITGKITLGKYHPSDIDLVL